MDYYGLNESEGLYYTLTIVNAFNNPQTGYLASAKRYSTEELSYVTIEQGITDSAGNVIFFLEPTILYKINIIDLETNEVIIEFDLVPGTTTNIELVMDTSEKSSYYDENFMYKDVTWSLSPTTSFFRNDTEVEYTVTSASGTLEESGILITKSNSTGTYHVYNVTSTQPSTVTFNYTFTEVGKYTFNYYWTINNYTTYANFYYYQYGGNSTMVTAQDYLDEFKLSGWSYYLIAVIVAMVFMVYTSRYSFTGASVIGLIILWAFTIFAPADMYIISQTVGGVGWTMNLYHLTSIVTIVVIALLYKRSDI